MGCVRDRGVVLLARQRARRRWWQCTCIVVVYDENSVEHDFAGFHVDGRCQGVVLLCHVHNVFGLWSSCSTGVQLWLMVVVLVLVMVVVCEPPAALPGQTARRHCRSSVSFSFPRCFFLSVEVSKLDCCSLVVRVGRVEVGVRGRGGEVGLVF